ncbi:diacylglycerol kinase family protein [Runella sp. SP2]|uniref:diacylglycerol kinase family protein n=1 Tax=Runella sp. SP2 TaxID=2268026 RepID=UPI000F08088B|nr:diacylglycerol kinase family protein [Runella sp. SP2]AYQ34788.1 diacylglycerol kinase family protein [Runella sp. SP2]
MVDIRKMIRSFSYAFEGVVALFRYENNARFHLIAAFGVVLLGIVLGLERFEWALVAIVIGAVWAAEAFNTAIEKLCDLVSPDYHPQIKAAKDLAAAGVMITSVVAVVVGAIVFGGKLWCWFLNM